jgi:hypothetical protein
VISDCNHRFGCYLSNSTIDPVIDLTINPTIDASVQAWQQKGMKQYAAMIGQLVGMACRRSHNMTTHLEREGSSVSFEG